MEITGEMIAGWRAERAASRTSAVGEYAPEEFWALLDEFERLSGMLDAERLRARTWRGLANDAADVLSAFAVGHATQRAVERAEAEEGSPEPDKRCHFCRSVHDVEEIKAYFGGTTLSMGIQICAECRKRRDPEGKNRNENRGA